MISNKIFQKELKISQHLLFKILFLKLFKSAIFEYSFDLGDFNFEHHIFLIFYLNFNMNRFYIF